MLFTNSKYLWLCFCSTLAPLAIKMHNWIIFPCPIFITIYSFVPEFFLNASLFAFLNSTTYFWAVITHQCTYGESFCGFLAFSSIHLTLLCFGGFTDQPIVVEPLRWGPAPTKDISYQHRGMRKMKTQFTQQYQEGIFQILKPPVFIF